MFVSKQLRTYFFFNCESVFLNYQSAIRTKMIQFKEAQKKLNDKNLVFNVKSRSQRKKENRQRRIRYREEDYDEFNYYYDPSCHYCGKTNICAC